MIWNFVKVLVLLAVIDLPWLMLTGRWSSALLHRVQLLPVELRWWAAAIVYIALTAIVLMAESVWQAGALGVATYAVYEFTNLSTFIQWDWRFSVVDSLWGGVLLASVKWLSGA